eukprot:514915-Amorphochlora_amoeboformis.AAC.1
MVVYRASCKVQLRARGRESTKRERGNREGEGTCLSRKYTEGEQRELVNTDTQRDVEQRLIAFACDPKTRPIHEKNDPYRILPNEIRFVEGRHHGWRT